MNDTIDFRDEEVLFTLGRLNKLPAPERRPRAYQPPVRAIIFQRPLHQWRRAGMEVGDYALISVKGWHGSVATRITGVEADLVSGVATVHAEIPAYKDVVRMLSSCDPMLWSIERTLPHVATD